MLLVERRTTSNNDRSYMIRKQALRNCGGQEGVGTDESSYHSFISYEDRHSYGLWAVNCAVLVSHPNNFLEKGPFFPGSQLSRVPTGPGTCTYRKCFVHTTTSQDPEDDPTSWILFSHLKTFECKSTV